MVSGSCWELKRSVWGVYVFSFPRRNLGRIDEALAALDRSIELKPDFPEAYNNKGMTLLVGSRREEALACFQAAVAANSAYVQAYWGAVQVLNALQRFSEAKDYALRGIEVRAFPVECSKMASWKEGQGAGTNVPFNYRAPWSCNLPGGTVGAAVRRAWVHAVATRRTGCSC